LGEISLDTRRELVAVVDVVLGLEKTKLSLPPRAGAGASPLPAEKSRQPRPLRSCEDGDSAGEQSDPEPAHEPILATPPKR